ncbi:MAG: hypothetical protein ACOYOL_02135 [Chthoniobacterales bacterium]
MINVSRPWANLEQRILRWIGDAAAESFECILPELHTFHFRHNAPYRAYCSSLGVQETLADWRHIPAVPQAAFKYAELRSFPTDETVKVFHTSGTTGEGFGRHSFRTLALYEAAVRAGWKLAGLPAGSYLVLAPHPDEAPHSSLSHMFSTLARPEDFMARGGVVEVERLRAAAGPVCLLGTSLAFLRLFEEMDRRSERLSLAPGSTAMETGGYKGSGREISRPALYAMFTERLGLAVSDIYNEYSMTELSSQFYARGPGGLHQGPPWARAVVAHPVTLEEVGRGETGILLIYDAANVGSVVGLRTQDLAVRREGGFELLGRDPAALPRGCSRAADEFFGRGAA